ncbi:helix-turn-helix transcriptional regulator [Actinocorallia aurea]
MSEVLYPDPAGSLWYTLAQELREFRAVLGLTGGELGQILRVDKSSVSKLEHGKLRLKPDQARLLDAWQRSLLLSKLAEEGRTRLARASQPLTPGRWELLVLHASREHSDDWKKAHQTHEERASNLRVWEPAWVPGLMQTPEYARANIQGGSPEEDVERLIDDRLERQERFFTGRRQYLWALIDESVLDRFTAHRDIMRAQLKRLLELSELDTIGLRVLPRGRFHAGLDGSFELMQFGDGSHPMAYTEAAFGWRLVSDVAEVESFALRYDRLGNFALPEDQTRDLIHKLMETI